MRTQFVGVQPCSRFLVEGAKGAVLHTGDLRAEPWFLESLKYNPFIQRYIDAPAQPLCGSTRGLPYHSYPIPKLDTIYLDTACLLNTYNVPPKVRVFSSCTKPGRRLTFST